MAATYGCTPPPASCSSPSPSPRGPTVSRKRCTRCASARAPRTSSRAARPAGC
eukprot:SM008857S23787  [mRNA]  locus=s8857:17:405:- [translate_table: standard]